MINFKVTIRIFKLTKGLEVEVLLLVLYLYTTL